MREKLKKNQRVTISLSELEVNYLRQESEKKDISISEFIRRQAFSDKKKFKDYCKRDYKTANDFEPEIEKNSIRKEITYKAAEYQVIEHQSTILGLSETNYIKKCSLNDKIYYFDWTEIKNSNSIIQGLIHSINAVTETVERNSKVYTLQISEIQNMLADIIENQKQLLKKINSIYKKVNN